MEISKWVQENWGLIATVLFIASELLGESEKIKSNSIYGFVRGFLKGEAKKAEPDVVKAIEK